MTEPALANAPTGASPLDQDLPSRSLPERHTQERAHEPAPEVAAAPVPHSTANKVSIRETGSDSQSEGGEKDLLVSSTSLNMRASKMDERRSRAFVDDFPASGEHLGVNPIQPQSDPTQVAQFQEYGIEDGDREQYATTMASGGEFGMLAREAAQRLTLGEADERSGGHSPGLPCSICESTTTRLVFRSSRNDTCCHTCYTGLWRDAVRVARRTNNAAQGAEGPIDTALDSILERFRKGVMHEGKPCATVSPGRGFKNPSRYSSTTPTKRRCARCRTRDTINRLPLLAHRLFLRALAAENMIPAPPEDVDPDRPYTTRKRSAASPGDVGSAGPASSEEDNAFVGQDEDYIPPSAVAGTDTRGRRRSVTAAGSVESHLPMQSRSHSHSSGGGGGGVAYDGSRLHPSSGPRSLPGDIVGGVARKRSSSSKSSRYDPLSASGPMLVVPVPKALSARDSAMSASPAPDARDARSARHHREGTRLSVSHGLPTSLGSSSPGSPTAGAAGPGSGVGTSRLRRNDSEGLVSDSAVHTGSQHSSTPQGRAAGPSVQAGPALAATPATISPWNGPYPQAAHPAAVPWPYTAPPAAFPPHYAAFGGRPVSAPGPMLAGPAGPAMAYPASFPPGPYGAPHLNPALAPPYGAPYPHTPSLSAPPGMHPGYSMAPPPAAAATMPAAPAVAGTKTGLAASHTMLPAPGYAPHGFPAGVQLQMLPGAPHQQQQHFIHPPQHQTHPGMQVAISAVPPYAFGAGAPPPPFVHYPAPAPHPLPADPGPYAPGPYLPYPPAAGAGPWMAMPASSV
eukprot:m.128638 g.128638  ORF g.128638 m.128638 type:complete len:796 (+) comp14734_c1_seq5:168-2555(+)